MHPAYSVIFFTTASGAGYGLLALLCLGGAFGLIPLDPGLGLAGFGLAFVLITAGLLASTFHLGRPERAWRALAEWRTSWLSREGILAIASYGPAGLVAFDWIFRGRMIAIIGVAAAVLAGLTVWSTGMIYACLKTIRQWHQPLTSPVYVVLALATGALLLHALLRCFGQAGEGTAWLAILFTLLALMLKLIYWSSIDSAKRTLTAGAATGLGDLGRVRPLDPPHTQPNFVMREMGYSVGRKHAQKLRFVAVMLLFFAPLMLTLTTLVLPPELAFPATLLAVLAAALGVLAERWLFFAEAQHVVTLYYGAETA